eukprot:s12809_g1.t1
MRSLRGDNSSQGTGADLNATLTYMTKNMFRRQDPYLWDNRCNAIKELTKELAKVVVQKGPAAANQSMLQQIQELQRENARWKSARAKSAATPKPAATPRVQVSIQHHLRSDQEQEHEHEPVQEEARDDEATIVPSPDFSPTGVLDQDFADPLETVQTFERTDQALFLEECRVDNYKMATINSWISHRVGKEKMPKVRNASDELLAAIDRLPPGNRPAIDAIAVGWGLPVTAAAKIGERSLRNLIATCYVLGQE